MSAFKDEMAQGHDAAEEKSRAADGFARTRALGRLEACDDADAVRNAASPAASVDAESALRSYYRAYRGEPSPDAKAAVMQATSRELLRLRNGAGAHAASEAAHAGRMHACVARIRETLAFVAEQARFMSVRTWVLQACVVAFAALLALAGGRYGASGVYVCLAGAAIAVCGLPEVMASRLCGIVELERSCKHDARAVAAARMAVTACANAVGIAIVAAAASYAHADVSFAFMLVCAFAPYCMTVAGCLVAVRRIGGMGALASAAAWGAVVVAVAYFADSRIPWLYEQASLWIWAVAAAGSSAWAMIEVRTWLSSVSHSARILLSDPSFINR